MPFSIELHFDQESSARVRSMWMQLEAAGISSYMLQHAVFPHISLAVFDGGIEDAITTVLQKINEEEAQFTIKMSNLGAFLTDSAVLFLAPAASPKLIDIHGRLYQSTKTTGVEWDRNYLPGAWVPHCTLGVQIPKSRLPDAMNVIGEEFNPFEVKVETIQLVEFYPVSLIRSYVLGKPSRGKESKFPSPEGPLPDERIIAITEENFSEWVELGLALWPDHSREGLTEDFLDLLHSEKEQAFICMVGSECVGFINVSIRSDYVEGSSSGPVGYVEGIYVKEAYRRRGIARILLAQGEKWAWSKGCTQMGSDIELNNSTSYDFHTGVGFEEANRIISFMKDIELER